MKKISTIDQYLALFPKEVQVKLLLMRKTIEDLVPDFKETISYGIPTVKFNGKNLVHFGAFKNHISFFPTSSPIQKFEAELSKYKISKGTIQFPLNEPLPLSLIKKIVRFRVEEQKKS